MKEDKGISPAALGALMNGKFENFMTASTPGGIEAQEAAGQADTIKSNKIACKAPWGQLKALGFKKLDEGDGVLCNAEFPEGWEMRATEHSMNSDLFDDKGRKRGSMFYKAAFYDRSASLYLSPRFAYGYDPEDHYKSEITYQERKVSPHRGEVVDNSTGEIIFSTEWKSFTQPEDGSWNQEASDYEDKIKRELKEWLNKNYPDWENPTAYWEDE